MAKSTPAALMLQKAGVAFKLHEYDYGPDAPRIGLQAEALGIAPSDREVHLKKLAAAAGAKSAAMLGAAEAERITSYHVGGISPFGQKRRVAVFVEESALVFERVVLNGGCRGLQVELKPGDLVRVLEATAADIC